MFEGSTGPGKKKPAKYGADLAAIMRAERGEKAREAAKHQQRTGGKHKNQSRPQEDLMPFAQVVAKGASGRGDPPLPYARPASDVPAI